MRTHKQILDKQQSQSQRFKNPSIINAIGSPAKDDDNEEEEEEISRSALATFRAKEEEIEKKKLEIRNKVQAQLARVEEATKRLAEIREVSSDALQTEPIFLFLKGIVFRFSGLDDTVPNDKEYRPIDQFFLFFMDMAFSHGENFFFLRSLKLSQIL